MDQAAAACGIISTAAKNPVTMVPAHHRNIRPFAPALSLRVLSVAAILMLLLGACATTDWETAPTESPGTVPEATTAFARGDFAAAAAAWESEALTAAPDRVAPLRISAADAWLLAGDVDSAERALRGVSKADLSEADRSRLNLVLADLSLRALRPAEADVLLQQAASALPAASQGRYRDLREQTQRMLSGPASMGLAIARQIGDNMRYYDPAAAVELMRALETVTSSELSVRAENPRVDQQWAGWLHLALAIRQNLVNPDDVADAMASWKLRYPFHLLTENEALDTWLRAGSGWPV